VDLKARHIHSMELKVSSSLITTKLVTTTTHVRGGALHGNIEENVHLFLDRRFLALMY